MVPSNSDPPNSDIFRFRPPRFRPFLIQTPRIQTLSDLDHPNQEPWTTQTPGQFKPIDISEPPPLPIQTSPNSVPLNTSPPPAPMALWIPRFYSKN